MLNLYDDLINLKGVGEKLSKLLKEKGFEKIEDLLYYLPIRYENRDSVKKISSVKIGEEGWFKGKVLKTKLKFSRYKRTPIVEVLFSDGEKSAKAVFFNQQYIIRALKKGDWLLVYGKAEKKDEEEIKFKVIPKKFEKTGQEPKEGITPVYERIFYLTSGKISKLINEIFFSSKIPENLPQEVIDKYEFTSRKENLLAIHKPERKPPLLLPHSPILKRLAYEELFYFQLALSYFREKQKNVKKSTVIKKDKNFIKRTEKKLPFMLTEDQKNAINEIIDDISSEEPMRRLLQGEVGSGKTLVAILSALYVVEAGFQAAFMAPTEILARQHFERVKRYNLFNEKELILLIGSMSKKEKKNAYSMIEKGEAKFIIGTHALFQEKVKYRNLRLSIVDEQHRFGVAQKTMITLKGKDTELLIMTATPIPRTLHLTLYSDLSISTLKTLPYGEKIIKTFIVPQKKREEMYKWIEESIKQGGNQGFIVFPLIEESDSLNLKDLTTYYEILKDRFKDIPLGILHGKMKAKEKEKIRVMFEKKEIMLLLTTSIIEVGIDVEEAHFIVIEHPERYGLSQLHQMRGRVGRRGKEGYCFLMEPKKSGILAKKRLKILKSTLSGFKIAEEDLKLRGQGNPIGKEQWGRRIFKFANPFEDIEILKETKELSLKYIKNSDKIPALKDYFLYLKRKVKEVSFN